MTQRPMHIETKLIHAGEPNPASLGDDLKLDTRQICTL